MKKFSSPVFFFTTPPCVLLLHAPSLFSVHFTSLDLPALHLSSPLAMYHHASTSNQDTFSYHYLFSSRLWQRRTRICNPSSSSNPIGSFDGGNDHWGCPFRGSCS